MKKIIMTLSFIAATLSAGQAMSAPAVVLDDVNLVAGQTSVAIDVYIQADVSAQVDAVYFELDPIAGFALTGVTIYQPTTDWIPTVVLGSQKFGATDYGFPSVAIDSNYRFATMNFSFADTFFDTIPSVQISFKDYVLGDLDGMDYNSVPLSGGLVSAAPVPVPAAAWLLGSGLLGLMGLRRKGSASCESVNIVE